MRVNVYKTSPQLFVRDSLTITSTQTKLLKKFHKLFSEVFVSEYRHVFLWLSEFYTCHSLVNLLDTVDDRVNNTYLYSAFLWSNSRRCIHTAMCS